MHFELRAGLRKAVASYLNETVTGIDLQSADFARLTEAKIETCPTELPADLATPVAFDLAAFLRKHSLPANCISIAEDVSQRLVREFDELGVAIEAKVEGGGYINVTIDQKARSLYLSEVLKNGAVCLYRPFSLLLGEEGPEVFQFSQLNFPQLVEERGDDELTQWFSALGSCAWNPGQRLMLISMLADREISHRAYAEGLFSRENLPWYLERYYQDSGRCRSALGLQKKGTEESKFVSQYLSEVEDELLYFRGKVFEGLVELHPIRLMDSLLSLLRGFYRFYNHPGVRALLKEEFSPLKAEALEQQLGAVEAIVRLGIEKIEIACEKSGLVLDKN